MKNKIVIPVIFITILLIMSACDNGSDSVIGSEDETFNNLNSPYLICASRNPGGVGFDFVYAGDKGGANFMDSLSVSDFTFDTIIRTTKAEKPDGSLAGMPFFKLADNAQAVNYSNVDSACIGLTAFQNLTADNIQSFTFQSDDAGFDMSSLTPGDTGKPLLSDVQNEYNKLVIGQKWKQTANNNTDGDELVWIIKTGEGRKVKMIVTDFPADPAPTATGYIALEWDFLE